MTHNEAYVKALEKENNKDKRIAELEQQLATTKLKLRTCSENCTTHELNEAKALAQLAEVNNALFFGADKAMRERAEKAEAQLEAMIEGLELQNDAINGSPEALKVTCQIVALAAKKYDPMKAQLEKRIKQLADADYCEDLAVKRYQKAEAQLDAIRKGHTKTVEYDLSPAMVESALRNKLIELGWTPPQTILENET